MLGADEHWEVHASVADAYARRAAEDRSRSRGEQYRSHYSEDFEHGKTVSLDFGEKCQTDAGVLRRDASHLTPCVPVGNASNNSQLCDAAGMVPIRDVNICIAIDEASVRRAEAHGRDAVGVQIISGPLILVRVVAEESDGNIVAIEDGDAALELGNQGVISVKADLAGAAKVFRDGADVFAVQIEVA